MATVEQSNKFILNMRDYFRGSPMIKVFSHPRSGTQLLQHCLQANFYQHEDLMIAGADYGHWSNRLKMPGGNATGKLFGNHRFYSELPEEQRRLHKAYIYRDGRAVALSVWRSFNFTNPAWASFSFAQFLRTPLDWRGSPGTRTECGAPIAAHWLEHVHDWHHHAKNTVFVRYEELVTNPAQVLEKLGEAIGRLPAGRIITEPVGLHPNECRIDRWQDYFSQDDLAYFFSIVPRDCPYLWTPG